MNTEAKSRLVAWAVTLDNVEAARRRYLNVYRVEAPPRPTIHRWVERFLRTGDINKRKKGNGRPITASGDIQQQAVKQMVEECHDTSIRQMSLDSGISKSSVHRCLQKLNYKPFKYTMVQELTGDDHDRRLQFCEWVRFKVSQDETFHKSICFSDEAVFHINGSVNKHNLHYWNEVNPHVKLAVPNCRESVVVWCMVGISGLLAYDISFDTMNSDRYCTVLSEKVVPYFTQRRYKNKYYQQDGAPPHYSLAAREILDKHLTNRWIGRRGTIEWPPRSPDLTICDFCIWGILRDKVYKNRPTTRIELARKIERELNNLAEDIFSNAYDSFMRRCEACIACDGYQFEQNF